MLEVHFNPHSHLHVEGRDLHRVLPVAPWEAVLGAAIEVSLPGGTLKVRLLQGTQNERVPARARQGDSGQSTRIFCSKSRWSCRQPIRTGQNKSTKKWHGIWLSIRAGENERCATMRY